MDLTAEVDCETDEHDHHEARGDQPDADGAALVTYAAGHDRSRYESSGEVTVAVTVRDPGIPGTARSPRLRRQETVTSTDPGVPTGFAKSDESIETWTVMQSMSWFARLARAASSAPERASWLVRAIEAVRAPSAAADSTAP
jgi:hypothetical protein